VEALKQLQVAKAHIAIGICPCKLCQVDFLDVSRDLRNGVKGGKLFQVGDVCKSTSSNFCRKCHLSTAKKVFRFAKVKARKLVFLLVSQVVQFWLKGGFRPVTAVVKSLLRPFLWRILLSVKDQHVLKELIRKGDKFLFVTAKTPYHFFD